MRSLRRWGAFAFVLVVTAAGCASLTADQRDALLRRIDSLGEAAETPGPRSLEQIKSDVAAHLK